MQELGAILSLAIAGVFFRVTLYKKLEPKMESLKSSFAALEQENLRSVLSNPKLASEMGASSEIITFLDNAFSSGYKASFIFALAMCVIAIFATRLIPKKKDAT